MPPDPPRHLVCTPTLYIAPTATYLLTFAPLNNISKWNPFFLLHSPSITSFTGIIFSRIICRDNHWFMTYCRKQANLIIGASPLAIRQAIKPRTELVNQKWMKPNRKPHQYRVWLHQIVAKWLTCSTSTEGYIIGGRLGPEQASIPNFKLCPDPKCCFCGAFCFLYHICECPYTVLQMQSFSTIANMDSP